MLVSSFIFIRLISVSLAPAAPARSTVVSLNKDFRYDQELQIQMLLIGTLTESLLHALLPKSSDFIPRRESFALKLSLSSLVFMTK